MCSARGTDRGADLEHGISCTPGRRGAVPSDPVVEAAYASAASSKAIVWVASAAAAARRAGRRSRPAGDGGPSAPTGRPGSSRPACCGSSSRRRWKAPPSGKDTSRVPYHDATSAVPSWASRPQRVARAPPGCRRPRPPDATPSRQPGIRHRRGDVVRARRRSPPTPGTTSRRQARGSTAMTSAPAALQQHRRVSRPTTPSPNDDDRLAEHAAGVERDLQRRLDHRQQRRRTGVTVAERHDVLGVERRSGPGGDGRRRRARRRRARTRLSSTCPTQL